MNKKICLPECVHYITRIPIEELVWMYDTKAYWWVDFLFNVVEKHWFSIKRVEKHKKWRAIAVMKKWNKTHAIVWNNWIELNPYAIDLSEHILDYFFIIK